MKPPECLLENCSPNGNVMAVVEQDANTCYFYLQGEKSSSFGMKSCWVRNLRPAPKVLDEAAMKDGMPPMLPRDACRHPDGGAPLQSAGLSVVWAEEGDAAALLENREILAVIPSWSGHGGFNGYARDCIGESPLCWELGTPETNAQFERYQQAQDCWKSWTEKPGPWPGFQKGMCQAIEGRFGKHSNYYAIDGGKWPPKGMLRIPQNDVVLLITVGMALRPQPQVELHFEDAAPHRRVELAVSLDATLPDDAIKTIAGFVSGQTGYPWSSHTFLGHGHTMPADAFAAISGGTYGYALLQRDLPAASSIELPTYRGDPVSLLWMTPVSERERTLAEEQGSAQLARKLREKGCDWKHSFNRREVV